MLLSRRNEIKLADLGISKLMENTHASTHVGTIHYMSPEVFKSLVSVIKYYPNTDIWYKNIQKIQKIRQFNVIHKILRSLGCVLFELKFLKLAFPIGQRNDPPIPINVSSSGIFSSILPKYFKNFFY